jgi:branched-chain amino acid aminotransferase
MRKPVDDHTGQIVWLNGAFASLDACRISPLDRGFLYGDGLFETLRAEEGRILFLDVHTARLLHSMEAFRLPSDGIPDWNAVLQELLARTNLDRGTAAVKIIVSRGPCEGMGLPASHPPSILIHARKYLAPTRQDYTDGWKLATLRNGYAPPLAAHKTLNYLFYLTARQAALDVGADEAILLDPWGRLAETSAGNLLLRTRGEWWTPASPHQLPGVTLRGVLEQMHGLGWEVSRRDATLPDLFEAETVYVLNSLMLVMPIQSIDNRTLPDPSPEQAEILREKLLRNG